MPQDWTAPLPTPDHPQKPPALAVMPALCGYHAQVIGRMAEHGHTDDDATLRAAHDLARQCQQCPGKGTHR